VRYVHLRLGVPVLIGARQFFESLAAYDTFRSLSQSSSALRTMVLADFSTSIWKRARENVELQGFTDCPQDHTKSQYAEVAFGKSYHVCTPCISDNFQKIIRLIGL